MIFYCPSEVPGLEKIVPGENVLMSDSKMIAAFCLANPLEKPWNWFPCDFGSDGTVQYQELYPNAFKECTEGKKGYIYVAEGEEDSAEASGELVSVFVPKTEFTVKEVIEIDDLYEWLMEEEDMGRFRLYLFEEKTKRDILLWDNSILRYLSKYKMIENPDCPYAKFVREKLPNAWAKYEKLCGK